MKSIQYISNSYSNDYRFGFNGKEKDKETYGEGNEYDYGFRIYNPRIGKFLSVDPLTKKYPWYTPYQFAGNQPIWAIDMDGLEEYIIHQYTYEKSRGGTVIYKVKFNKTPASQQATNASKVNTYYNPGSEWKYNYVINERPKIEDKDVQQFKDNDDVYKKIRGLNKGSGFMEYTFHFDHFGDDKGRAKDQVEEKFNSSTNEYKDHIDGVVSMLVNDPNTKLEITGFASPYETNIDGTLNTLSVDNNKILANQRAVALKEYVKDYAKKNYNGAVISDDRFSTVGKVPKDAISKDERGKCQGVAAKITEKK